MAKLTDQKAFEGETLTATFENVAADVISILVILKSSEGSVSKVAVLDDDKWSVSIGDDDLGDISGQCRWVAMANSPNGSAVIANGSIYIRPLVSKWRDYVTAIDSAIQTWSANPNHTITVGEISITAKTLDDLLALRADYLAKANADENGRTVSTGPRVMKVRF